MDDLRETIDRRVFEQMWRDGDFTIRVFLCLLYRPCYPHWPEFA